MTEAVKHAGSLIKCVDGQYRWFKSLCGALAVGSNDQLKPVHPDAVTCKACKRSRAWGDMLRTHKEAGKL